MAGVCESRVEPGDQDESNDRETQLESEDRIAKANLNSGIAKRELKSSRKCSLS